jgi:hypothetical protein
MTAAASSPAIRKRLAARITLSGSRTGDPALGEFEDAVILKSVGEVDIALLSV